MKYQLVLQWTTSAARDFDAIIAIEELLDAKLSRPGEVDGHDFGSGEANIFLVTDRPEEVFREVRGILTPSGAFDDVRVAFRDVDGEEYTVLWPEGLSEFDVT
jgi:hypothetical protein